MVMETTAKVTCDVRDCKNLANYYVATKQKGGKLFLCKQCLGKINARPPKSPANKIKKQQEQKQMM